MLKQISLKRTVPTSILKKKTSTNTIQSSKNTKRSSTKLSNRNYKKFIPKKKSTNFSKLSSKTTKNTITKISSTLFLPSQILTILKKSWSTITTDLIKENPKTNQTTPKNRINIWMVNLYKLTFLINIITCPTISGNLFSKQKKLVIWKF